MGPASWVSPLGMPCCCFRADGGPQRGVLGILGCGAKVWLGYRPPAGQLTGGQEKKVAEERGERNGRGRGRQERGGQAWSGGGGGGRRWGPPAAGTEAAPISIPQAASLRLAASPSLRPVSGQGQRPAPGSLAHSERPACGPAGVGTVTVAKCANLCHCPQARGSHGDWLI